MAGKRGETAPCTTYNSKGSEAVDGVGGVAGARIGRNVVADVEDTTEARE